MRCRPDILFIDCISDFYLWEIHYWRYGAILVAILSYIKTNSYGYHATYDPSKVVCCAEFATHVFKQSLRLSGWPQFQRRPAEGPEQPPDVIWRGIFGRTKQDRHQESRQKSSRPGWQRCCHSRRRQHHPALRVCSCSRQASWLRRFRGKRLKSMLKRMEIPRCSHLSYHLFITRNIGHSGPAGQ